RVQAAVASVHLRKAMEAGEQSPASMSSTRFTDGGDRHAEATCKLTDSGDSTEAPAKRAPRAAPALHHAARRPRSRPRRPTRRRTASPPSSSPSSKPLSSACAAPPAPQPEEDDPALRAEEV